MVPVLHLQQRRQPLPPADPLGPALALYLAAGMTEAEALHALHARLLGRAAALGVRLHGELE